MPTPASTHCKGLLWPFKFPFHEQMKHFILYDFPAMAAIPFHLSGTGDGGRRTRVLGCWQLVLGTGEDVHIHLNAIFY